MFTYTVHALGLSSKGIQVFPDTKSQPVMVVVLQPFW